MLAASPSTAYGRSSRHVDRRNSRRSGAVFQQFNLFRIRQSWTTSRWRRCDGSLEEGARRNHVAARRHIGIDDLAKSVDGAVDIVPATADARVAPRG
jgi:hypothetical protein